MLHTVSKWLMSIFSRKSKTVHLEVRASDEPGPTVGQGELAGAPETAFEHSHANDRRSISLSAGNNKRVSLELKSQFVDLAAGSTVESVATGQPAHPPAVPDMVPRAPSNHEQKDPRAKNVVIFGETGSGKSSVINVLAQKRLAKTSNDAPGCTSEPQSYSVEISDQKFVLIDTAGLNEGTEGTVPPKQAIKQLKSLLRKHMKSRSPSDGVDLLVYCVRSATPRSALVYAHDTFYSRICQMKVPMVVVVTGLEEETPMEGWWNTDTTRQKFEGMQIAGHACVTTIQEYPGIPNELISRVAESSEILRDLVVKKYVVDDSFSAGAWCWSP